MALGKYQISALDRQTRHLSHPTLQCCTGFKVEPEDRMQKVFSELDTLWQVCARHSTSYLVQQPAAVNAWCMPDFLHLYLCVLVCLTPASTVTTSCKLMHASMCHNHILVMNLMRADRVACTQNQDANACKMIAATMMSTVHVIVGVLGRTCSRSAIHCRGCCQAPERHYHPSKVSRIATSAFKFYCCLLCMTVYQHLRCLP